MYQRLGDLYVDKQRFQDAAAAYRAYVTRNPVSEFSPSLAMAGIEAYRKGGFPQRVLEGQRDFIDLYRFDSAFWQGRKREQFPEIEQQLKLAMKDVATWYHANAQASKKPDDYRAAALRYRDLLASFPAENDTPANRYLLADTLFEAQQYNEATVEYERTAYDYPVNDRSDDAAYAGVVSRARWLATLQGEPRAQWHRESIDASIRFATQFEAHPESALVITRAAQDVFELPDLARAITVAEQVLVHRGVDVPKQRIAWTIIGQSQFELGKFPEAEVALGKARDLLPPNDKMRTDLSERMAASVYKQAEARRNAGDLSGAVDDFLRVAAVSPNSPVRATAEYDAAAALVNLKAWPRAIEVLTAYRRNYPASEYQRDVTRKLAVAYNESSRFGEAAVEFERISLDTAEDAALRRESLLLAADAFEKAGNSTKLGASLERFVASYPRPVPEAIEARQRLVTLAADRNDKPKLEFWRREIIKADAAAGAERNDRTRTLAGRAQLALAEPARDAFNRIKLVLPLKKSLDAKRKALDTALKGYRAAADYQVAGVTASSNYAMAELYRQLARDLLASQRPKNLGKDALEEYDLLLEEQAFPFEEQAIELHEINTSRAREGWYDEGVRSSFAALAELKPGRYAKSEVGVKPGLEPESDPARREADLRRVLEADSRDVATLNALGIVLRQQGKFNDARKAYEDAIAANPADAQAYRNLGVLQDLYLGDPDAALPLLERYKELTGEDKPVSTWIAEVRTRARPPAPPPQEPQP
jgi:tetratricopeptide (TPR) repeat protein